MTRRQAEGRETLRRLLDWQKGQAASERLASRLLSLDGFASVDPSHPLGGPDSLKDIVCAKADMRWVAGSFFPRGPKPATEVKKKFNHDGDRVNDLNSKLHHLLQVGLLSRDDADACDGKKLRLRDCVYQIMRYSLGVE